MKYDSVDCKITEGENALSVLADKRQTQEKWMDGMMSEGDRIWFVKITFWSFLSADESHDCDLQQAGTCRTKIANLSFIKSQCQEYKYFTKCLYGAFFTIRLCSPDLYDLDYDN